MNTAVLIKCILLMAFKLEHLTSRHGIYILHINAKVMFWSVGYNDKVAGWGKLIHLFRYGV